MPAPNGSAPVESDYDNPETSGSLRQEVEKCLKKYFEQLDNTSVTGLYDLVLAEVEAPLLEAVLRHAGSNQSKASIILGMNRGTLRKKMKQHGLL
ncbi:MAG: DNA-binding transcriptional regulator Fis [Pseudomonadales bacterium]|nr:DNA-binding transcriptional regulator Fis [Pseudomonadales bacterium]